MKNFGKGSMTLKRRERYCEILFWTDIRPVSNRQTACFGSTYGRAEERTVWQCGKQIEGWESQRKREGGLALWAVTGNEVKYESDCREREAHESSDGG